MSAINQSRDFDTLQFGAGFKQYMRDKGYKSASYGTECLWVQRYGLVKLDEEYEKDRCETILARLSNNGEFRKFVGAVKVDAHPESNLSSYRSAVKKYVEFMDSVRYGDGTYERQGNTRRGSRRNPKSSGVKISYLPGFGPGGKAELDVSATSQDNACMAEINELWREYMDVTNRITAALGRSSNIVGEFAERLVAEHYGGSLLAASHKSADVELPDGRLVQVKSRIPRRASTTSLSSIRSWDFDLLVVVLFDRDGGILKAVEYEAAAAKRHARRDEHQNSDLIVTTDEFLNDPLARDITADLARLLKSTL